MTRQLLLCAALMLPTAPAWAQQAAPLQAYVLDDQPIMDEQGIKLLRYKTQRLRIEANQDTFEIIEGVSNTMTHRQLLQRVGQTERLKVLDEQKARAELVSAIGYGIGAVGLGFLTKSAIAPDNFSLWVGLGALGAGLGLSLLAEPPGQDEQQEPPILSLDEARAIVNRYNLDLRRQLGLAEDVP